MKENTPNWRLVRQFRRARYTPAQLARINRVALEHAIKNGELPFQMHAYDQRAVMQTPSLGRALLATKVAYDELEAVR